MAICKFFGVLVSSARSECAFSTLYRKRICRMDDSASNTSLPEWATGVLWCPSTTLIVAIYWSNEKHCECGTGLWSHLFVVFWSSFERYIDENTSLQIFDGYIAFIIVVLTTTIFWNPLLRCSSLNTPRFSAQLHPGLYRCPGCSAQSRYHETIAWNTSLRCVLRSQFSVPGTCSDRYCKHSTLACSSICSITCAVAFWVVAEHKAVSRADSALEGPAIRGKLWMREYTRRPEAKPFPFPCLAGSKLDPPAQLSCCWRLQKNCSQPTKIAHRKNCSINLLTENQICSRRINFAHGELWIALQSTCNLSMYAWHNFYLTQIAQSEENLLTVKKNCSQKSNLLRARICSQQKFAHRICSLHRKTAHDEKPCRIGWINTMTKCFVSSQSEHGWRAPLNGLSRNGWNVLGRTFLASRRFICIILGSSYEYQVPGTSTLYSYFPLPILRVNSSGKTELWLWIGCVCIIAVRNSCLRQCFGNGTKWIIALWLQLRVS